MNRYKQMFSEVAPLLLRKAKRQLLTINCRKNDSSVYNINIAYSTKEKCLLYSIMFGNHIKLQTISVISEFEHARDGIEWVAHCYGESVKYSCIQISQCLPSRAHRQDTLRYILQPLSVFQ